ncbi:MAG: TonB-dependent receptor [Edaphobacter sp.]|uniref:TonB-dependent receptor plug domain-containing protein n=1 Tax=Edaphobacter sp. TaxID=1934404 RepID=UPI00238A136C|nr:TonB-dependent receptor [Edaphobacter sp.]MDE1178522.1 TonB-dependent receptor [Edaphobacter sp.]
MLVNGLRVNDPETAHLNLDIAVPMDALARVEVLHGSGSTFYGSDAIGGAVNLLTERPAAPATDARRLSLFARSGAGNYGSLENHLRVDYSTRRVAEEIAGSRDTSNGFMADRNYSSNALSSETWLNLLPLGTTDVLLAGSDRPYGANQFYGAYDSWERTKGWFASIQQQMGSRMSGSFAYRKHTDLFVLLLDRPNYYRNNHVTGAWQSALRRADPIGTNTTISYGLEANGDSIHSTNLGVHARNQGAGYVNVSLRALKRFSLSLGAREQVFTGPAGGAVFSPNVAAAYTLSSTVRLRGAVGHGYRQPTYLDLYYSDPTTVGNPNLKAESAWSYEGGVDWTPSRLPLTLTATGFSLHQRNGIDYSKYDLSQPWQANNVANYAYNGAEASARFRLPRAQQLQLGYTAVQATAPPKGLISEYAFNYAAQSALIAWSGTFAGQIAARSQLAVVQKTTQSPYALWDVALSRSAGRVRPYVRALNLTDTRYEEVPGVPVQGRTVMAGAEFSWAKGR